MRWTTYLVLYFGTGGSSKPTEIVSKIESLNFTSALGPVDFTYDWNDKKPNKEEVLMLANKISEILTGTNCVFNLDTHD
jgi:hypothetical protein